MAALRKPCCSSEILYNGIMHQVTRHVHDSTNRHFTKDLGDFIQPQGSSYSFSQATSHLCENILHFDTE